MTRSVMRDPAIFGAVTVGRAFFVAHAMHALAFSATRAIVSAMSRLRRVAVLAFMLAALAAPTGGCGGGWGGDDWHPWQGVLVFAVTDAGDLIAFRSGDPSQLEFSAAITGLAPAESIVAVDFRPSSGVLYGVGDSGRLYTIDTASGAATAVSPAPFAVLAGTKFDIDFDPVADVVRLVSDADQNLRINPDTGLLAVTDVLLAYDPADPESGSNPGVVGLAYTHSFDGATVSTAFALDTDADSFVRLGGLDGVPSPSGGVLFTVGSLGLNAVGPAGLDVVEVDGLDRVYAVVTTPGSASSLLLRIEIATGDTTFLGELGSSDAVRSIAVAP
jgi:hypothetical protein